MNENREYKMAFVKIGALWLDENGNLKGKLGDATCYIKPNKFKKNENHPSHEIVVAQKIFKKKEPLEPEVEPSQPNISQGSFNEEDVPW